MGFYEKEVLPRLVELALGGAAISKLRRRAVSGLGGTLLEIGFGSGLNVPHYPAEVNKVLAVDPSLTGRKLADPRLAASHVEVVFVGLDGEELAVEDSSVDNALSTFTLCTIPDAARALAEIHRVLRPGGALHFLEHGRSPEESVAKWQDRLSPLQQRLAGGCHLNRRIDLLLEGAGLEIEALENFYMKGPKPYGYVFEGIARRPQS